MKVVPKIWDVIDVRPMQKGDGMPLTVAELIDRLRDFDPAAPIYGYWGAGGFWFQAEPVNGEDPATIIKVSQPPTGGGAAE